MAYQNVGTPRFYVDRYQWLKAMGMISSEQNPVNNGLNPTSTKEWHLVGDNNYNFWYQYAFQGGIPIMNDINYVALLGHNLASIQGHFNMAFRVGDEDSDYFESVGGYVNVSRTDGNWYPEHDGFSIDYVEPPSTPVGADGVILRIGAELANSSEPVNTIAKIGSFSYGTYYEMPQSPDLNLKLSYEYDGVKTIQSKNGRTLSNAMYTKPAGWGDSGAWQLGDNPNYRTGRRTWDLSFSYLADTDMFPVNANQSHAAYTNVGYHSALSGSTNPTSGFLDIDILSEDGGTAGQFQSNILSGQDFFSVVWNKTLGNALPFIFQPDNTNSNPDQFAICKFIGDTLQYEQVAHNTYNIKLKIEEVW